MENKFTVGTRVLASYREHDADITLGATGIITEADTANHPIYGQLVKVRWDHRAKSLAPLAIWARALEKEIPDSFCEDTRSYLAAVTGGMDE